MSDTAPTVIALPGVKHPDQAEADREAARHAKRVQVVDHLRALADRLEAGAELSVVCIDCERPGEPEQRTQMMINCKPPMAMMLANMAHEAALQRFMGAE